MREQGIRPTTSEPVRSRLRRLAYWLPALLWMGVIFGLSSLPGSKVPSRFGTEAHFVEYAVLGVLYLAALPRGSRIGRVALVALALASLYAITDELHQAFVPGRVPDIADWLVDTLGAATSTGLAWTAAALRRRGGQ